MLANAALLTATLMVPNPLDAPPWPVAMKLRPPRFTFFLMLVAWSAFTLSPRLVLGSGLTVILSWSVGVGVVALRSETVLGFGLPDARSEALARYLDPRLVDVAAWASTVFTACPVTAIFATVVVPTRRLEHRGQGFKKGACNRESTLLGGGSRSEQ
ncbi:hypothetical protein [Methylobacterium oryzisoli]|uniref:hypothetical protein n=1 Tax=Methylobacterium oryzisoli TaxID=3385502 RepID=UPI0038929471